MKGHKGEKVSDLLQFNTYTPSSITVAYGYDANVLFSHNTKITGKVFLLKGFYYNLIQVWSAGSPLLSLFFVLVGRRWLPRN